MNGREGLTAYSPDFPSVPDLAVAAACALAARLSACWRGALTVTSCPARSRSAPSTTTCWPACEAAVQNRHLSLGQGDLHRLDSGRRSLLRRVGIDHPHIRALIAALDRRRRHHQRVGPLFHHQMNVDELVGKQRLVLVVEDRLQLVGSGGGVDLVVGGEQIAAGQLHRIALVVGLHRQALLRRAAFAAPAGS